MNNIYTNTETGETTKDQETARCWMMAGYPVKIMGVSSLHGQQNVDGGLCDRFGRRRAKNEE